jgi:lipoprotein signal peptidase
MTVVGLVMVILAVLLSTMFNTDALGISGFVLMSAGGIVNRLDKLIERD